MLENIIYLFVGAILAILPNYVTDAIKHRRQKILKKENEKKLLKAFCEEINVAIVDFYNIRTESSKMPTSFEYSLYVGLWELTKSKIFEKIEDREILRLLVNIYDHIILINAITRDTVKRNHFQLSQVLSKIDISNIEKKYILLKEEIQSKYKIKFNALANG